MEETRPARPRLHDADQIVADTREAVRTDRTARCSCRCWRAADEAANALEDAAFLLALEPLEGKPLDALQELANLLAAASQEWVKAVGHAGQIGHAAGIAETEDFLAAIASISKLEHQADDTERDLAASAVRHAADFR